MALGSHVSIAIAKDQLILAGNKGASFSIPASAITAISSNLTSEHTVTRSQMAAWGGLAQFSPYTLMFLPFGIPVMAATYPMKSKYAYISVLWSEKGTDQEVQFRLDRKDYDPFLKQLLIGPQIRQLIGAHRGKASQQCDRGAQPADRRHAADFSLSDHHSP